MKDPKYESQDFRLFSYLKRGLYAEQIERWFSFFPREQILIITNEDLNERPLEVMNEVFTFLHLPSYDNLKIERESSHYKPMNAHTRQKLVEFFRPHNQQLEELLNRDFGWDK